LKHIYFTVTNDLVYDQRMHRICTSLATNGFIVTLVGRIKKSSPPLESKPYHQHRLHCVFEKGFLFYAEYNLRLFFYLLTQKMDCICAIDLDTILSCLFVSKLKGIQRVFDAHEYFTEMKEVRRRKIVQWVWMAIEKFSVPKFKFCYTVSEGLAEIFSNKYNRHFIAIRNISLLKPIDTTVKKKDFILYQGAVNEGRGLDQLILAMRQVSIPLIICGDGNYMHEVKNLIPRFGLEEKVILKGMLLPSELQKITPEAILGINLTDTEDLHHKYALPNKFFDYIHALVPQITMNLPEYAKINQQFEVAVSINALNADTIAKAINNTLSDNQFLIKLRTNCIKAREVFSWQNEEKKLLHLYNNIWENNIG